MPVFLPPRTGSKAAKAAYLIGYLTQMAERNQYLTDAYGAEGEPDYRDRITYYKGRAEAFTEAADCLRDLAIHANASGLEERRGRLSAH